MPDRNLAENSAPGGATQTLINAARLFQQASSLNAGGSRKAAVVVCGGSPGGDSSRHKKGPRKDRKSVV